MASFWNEILKVNWDAWTLRIVAGDRLLAMQVLAKSAHAHGRYFFYSML